MAEIKVKTGREEGATSVSVNYELPASTSAAVEKYGEETALDLINRSLTLGVQALVRTQLGKEEGVKDPKKLQEMVDAWVPGVRGPVVRQTPLERASSALKGMDANALAELLAKVKAAQKAAPAA